MRETAHGFLFVKHELHGSSLDVNADKHADIRVRYFVILSGAEGSLDFV
jgi:hypothetical protein